MVLQNRVNPFGEIISTPERGLFMGNRGILHNERRELLYPKHKRVPWVTKAWIICQLEFKGRKRQIMAPGHYTELFFLDEATALAAGHRPCAECRREAYSRFKTLWVQAHGDMPIDATLHQERTDRKGNKQTYSASIATLPTGTFIRLDGKCWLIAGERLCEWSSGGYVTDCSRPTQLAVEVLTPRSTVAVLALGYAPHLHPSAIR